MRNDNCLETDHMAAARETIARAEAAIAERLASIDQTTRNGQYMAAASRFQLSVLAAALLWLAGEAERGTSFPVRMNALENGIANILISLLDSHGLPKEIMRECAEQLLSGIARDLHFMIHSLETRPGHPDRIGSRAVLPEGRA